ncbi:hypothetical protein CLV82_1873 [Zeaxanthinibacter enoshimensis]|uniref:O-antigen ligase-like membrane protein n=2 Tax=Zeaxanthinibacter enoshimensis TaxID=392009 RepID=A0A4R6TP85_9FLAO|nr:hypothetical protein CLV82_1873 [Zeaxanthinibacter enoshimensis]
MASVILIFATAIIAIFLGRSKYKFSVYFAYFAILITVILNFIVSGGDFLDMTHVMDSKGIGTWITLALIFVSYNSSRFKLLEVFLLIAIFYISLLTIYNFIDFGVGGWRGQALNKYRVYATTMVWIVPYYYLITKPNPKLKWLRVYALFFGLILALITQTRSFLIIYFLTIMFDFFNTKNRLSYSIFLFAGGIAFLLIVLNTEIFSNSLELLINRGTHDTRSEQLGVFLSQLNPIKLITGSGFFASYRYGYQQWTAVDNQWLLLLWWAGIIPVIAYFYLTAVIPLKMALFYRLDYETKVECFILILWVLGLTGLAIFTTMTIDLFFFIICILLGRVLYKFSNLCV